MEKFERHNPLETPAVLVAHHGPFTWGVAPADALLHSLILEEVARLTLGTLTLAPDAQPIPGPLLDKHYRRKHGPDAYYGQT